MHKSRQSYCTKPERRRIFSATAGLLLVHAAAAILLHWQQTNQVASLLVMRVDQAFYHYQAWRVLTGTFFYIAEPWEIVWLILFLAPFGWALEKKLSAVELVWFYCLTGIGSCLIWGIATVAWEDKLPLATSGAITAVITLLLLKDPSRRFKVRRLVVPAWSMALLYYGVEFRFYEWDSWSLSLPAHLGGVIGALLYHQFDLRWYRLLVSVKPEIPTPAVSEIPPVHVETLDEPVAAVPDADDEQEILRLDSQVDQVLEKISRAGSQSLTEQEKKLLQHASERYRRRRH